MNGVLLMTKMYPGLALLMILGLSALSWALLIIVAFSVGGVALWSAGVIAIAVALHV